MHLRDELVNELLQLTRSEHKTSAGWATGGIAALALLCRDPAAAADCS